MLTKRDLSSSLFHSPERNRSEAENVIKTGWDPIKKLMSVRTQTREVSALRSDVEGVP